MRDQRKRLADIVHADSGRDQLARSWTSTAAAAEITPVPPGDYTLRILTGALFAAKKRGTPGYRLTLQVTEGEHAGQRVWADLWLTPDAIAYTKRDLAKIGITQLEQLEVPMPPGILLRGRVGFRRDDDGTERNRLVRFECVGVEPDDAFAPRDAEDPGPADSPSDSDTPPGNNNSVASAAAAAPSPSSDGRTAQ